MKSTIANIKVSRRWFVVLLCMLFIISSCKKAVEIEPPITGLVSSSVFSSNATASAAMAGIYVSMSGTGAMAGGTSGLSAVLGLASDELVPYPNSQVLYTQVYNNSLNNLSNITFWNQLYNYIYQANVVIEKLSDSSAVTQSLRQQLIGEAKFVRALCHFYLVNVYGDVPISVSSDYRINGTAKRSAKTLVYQQIISDLIDARGLLNDNYVKADGIATYPIASAERVRPNRAAAIALLARTYLYNGDWANAENQASLVINNSSYYSLPALANAFLKNNTEAIWQLQVVVPNTNTPDGQTFVLAASGGPNTGSNPFFLSNFFLNSFEPGDGRKSYWISSMSVSGITYYYPYKYKQGTGVTAVSEYTTILRLAEQYLIRAEARAQQNNLAGAIADINVIRTRARAVVTTAVPNPLPDLTGTLTQSQLLAAIEQERRVELFTEYGHRWLDLKREKGFNDVSKSRADEIMPAITTAKGGSWNTYWQWFPVPLVELQNNINLVQTPGY